MRYVKTKIVGFSGVNQIMTLCFHSKNNWEEREWIIVNQYYLGTDLMFNLVEMIILTGG